MLLSKYEKYNRQAEERSHVKEARTASGFECQLCKQIEVLCFQTKITQLVQNKTTFI